MRQFRYAGSLLQRYFQMRDRWVSLAIRRINLLAQSEQAKDLSNKDMGFRVNWIVRQLAAEIPPDLKKALMNDPEARQYFGIRRSQYDLHAALINDVLNQITLDLSSFPEHEENEDEGEELDYLGSEVDGFTSITFEIDRGYSSKAAAQVAKSTTQKFRGKAVMVSVGEGDWAGTGYFSWSVSPRMVTKFVKFFKQLLRQHKIHLYDMEIEGQQEFSEW